MSDSPAANNKPDAVKIGKEISNPDIGGRLDAAFTMLGMQKSDFAKVRQQVEANIDMDKLGLKGFHLDADHPVVQGAVVPADKTQDHKPHPIPGFLFTDDAGHQRLLQASGEEFNVQNKQIVGGAVRPADVQAPPTTPTDGTQPRTTPTDGTKPTTTPTDGTQPTTTPTDGTQPTTTPTDGTKPTTAPTDGSVPGPDATTPTDATAPTGDQAKVQQFLQAQVEAESKSLPVKRGEGYYQVLRRMHSDWTPEQTSAEAHRIKTINGNNINLKVGDQLPLMTADQKQAALQQALDTYSKASPADQAALLAQAKAAFPDAPAPTTTPTDGTKPTTTPTDGTQPTTTPTDGTKPTTTPTDGTQPTTTPTDGTKPTTTPTDGTQPTTTPTDGTQPTTTPTDGTKPTTTPTDGTQPTKTPTDGTQPTTTPTDGTQPTTTPTDGTQATTGADGAIIPLVDLATSANLKPTGAGNDNDFSKRVYNPLAPIGLTEGTAETNLGKSTLGTNDRTVKASADGKSASITGSLDDNGWTLSHIHKPDGSGLDFNWSNTKFKTDDTFQDGKLASRTTTYDRGISMNFASNDATKPVHIDGVTKVDTHFDGPGAGGYVTQVTGEGGKVYTFKSDQNGNVTGYTPPEAATQG